MTGAHSSEEPVRGRWKWVVAAVLVCVGLGFASGLVVGGGGSPWYQALAKPVGTPPPWIFGPVWTVLYVMMGVAWGRLLGGRHWREATWFAVQFFFNLVWTPLFFGVHAVWLALAVILVLWAALWVTLIKARRVDPVAGWLLVPYAVWVGYASYLNGGIAWLNR